MALIELERQLRAYGDAVIRRDALAAGRQKTSPGGFVDHHVVLEVARSNAKSPVNDKRI
ncbi:MAG: hypothetical protein JSR78_06410 [Proteobacteria bacterium]|nr:hypothetical protein [Pseudomonadota bacterium]